ncbi:MAG: glycogen debranching enzyme family protein [Deltaproteobacteria bacterium]|nr:glycogen debranching enzyme family protein [Deltaproteobacteria bacterium]
MEISDCKDIGFEDLLKREWLDVNGRGGYASSTLLNCHTRKYHGLLTANLSHPGGRFVLLSKCEESVHCKKADGALSIHRYPDLYFPSDDYSLTYFSMKLCPHFSFTLGGEVEITKEYMLVADEDTLFIRYHVESAPSDVRILVRPFFAYRDIHALSQENGLLNDYCERLHGGFVIKPYEGMPPFYMVADGDADLTIQWLWYRNFEYERERKRGFPYREDLFTPAAFSFVLATDGEMIFRCSTDAGSGSVGSLWQNEYDRRGREYESSRNVCDEGDACLRKATGSYIIRNRRDRFSVIAGYHWFYEWGRDTLISLPGLTFYSGRIHEGIEILKSLASLTKGGRIPNNISEEGEEGSYNSVDASLWFFWCLQEYLRVTGDRESIMEDFWAVFLAIAESFISGELRNGTILDNGLICAGDEFTQLTWMDAKVGNLPVTPRHGCAVEINALWFNALSFLKQLSLKHSKPLPFDAEGLMEKMKDSFHDLFWLPDSEYLADTWNPDDGTCDSSMRPNQIFALSLPNPIVVDGIKGAAIVKRVTDELYTEYGLRTLSPKDSLYCGHYGETVEERDSSYHQGTVWPWLIGHYGEAILRYENDKGAARKRLNRTVAALENHLQKAGVGHISEIFSGDAPHEPDGCIAQAWSVAELVRLKDLLRR